MKDIKVGFIGLGARGKDLLEQIVVEMVSVTAVCDFYADRAEAACEIVKSKGQAEPFVSTDYKAVINNENVNTVIIATSWDTHVEIATYAMRAGKAVALEVGGAYDIKDCWDLVNTYEATKTPFMFLENCCFGEREMLVLNMVKQGLFGKVVHCSGGYHHDLRKEIAFGVENRHYRLKNYLNRNCHNYPTHDLGPIAKVLNINHGNKLLSLVSVASKSEGMHDYIEAEKSDDKELLNAEFKQADIVTTLIKCAGGETISLTLDTTLPRFYSRGFTVRGTKAMFDEATDSIFMDGKNDMDFDFTWRKEKSGNAEEYKEKYEHPVWQEYRKQGVKGTHDGMDWLEFKTFFECLREDKPMPVDVYDAATWMSITALSEASITNGSQPVAIPDFTRGKWLHR